MPAKQAFGDLIVIIPGIIGSGLERDGRELWGKGVIARALTSRLKVLTQLELDSPDADDGIRAHRTLHDTTIFPGLMKIDGYTKIQRTLQDHFTARPGENLFEFPYDWRRDNRRSAKILAKKTDNWLHAWRKQSGNDDAKLVLMAHSMGGLVSRYFLEVLGGWRNTRTLITFGTPYRGAIDPLELLTNGLRPMGRLGADLSSTVASFPSVHQLVATWPCYDHGDGELARPLLHGGVPNLKKKMAADAHAFHEEIIAAVAANRADGDWDAHGYKIHPTLGIAQPTHQTCKRDGDGIKLREKIGGKRPGGDGRVSRYSAIPREMDVSSGMHSPVSHGSLQNSDGILTHVKGLLSGSMQTNALFLGDDDVRIGLRVPDLALANEPLSIDIDAQGELAGDLLATIANVETGESVSETQLAFEDHERKIVELPNPGAGTWRVTITGQDVIPNSDIWMGANEAD